MSAPSERPRCTQDSDTASCALSARLYRYADQRWREAGLADRLRLHQAHHSYASFMIAAGVNPKALSSFMGHSSITVTFDLYGHLMPGTGVEGGSAP